MMRVINGAEVQIGPDANLRRADLSGAVLSGASLRRADLSWANLRRADLSGADLRGADLRRADLSWASLRRADLSGASLRWANLREADLRRAVLSGANLSWADLREADLRGADLLRTGVLRVHGSYEATIYPGELAYGCERHSLEDWPLLLTDLACKHEPTRPEAFVAEITALLDLAANLSNPREPTS